MPSQLPQLSLFTDCVEPHIIFSEGRYYFKRLSFGGSGFRGKAIP